MNEDLIKIIPILAMAAFYILKSVLQAKKAQPTRFPPPEPIMEEELTSPVDLHQTLEKISLPVPLPIEKKNLAAKHNPIFFPKKTSRATNMRRLAKQEKNWIVLSEVLQKKF